MDKDKDSKDNEDKEVPESIKKYHKLADHIDMFIDTMEQNHLDAHAYAVDNVLREKKEGPKGEEKPGLVKYGLLKQTKKQVEFAERMAGYYVERARQHFRTKLGEKDDYERKMLLNNYSKFTNLELKKMVAKHKNKFDAGLFSGIRSNLMDNVRREMNEVAAGHIEEKDIDDIVAYTGADEKVYKDRLTRQDAINLLTHHKKKGIIPQKDLGEIINDYAVKEEYR